MPVRFRTFSLVALSPSAFLALFAASTLYLGPPRKGADVVHPSCRKASCGVLASPINRNKLEKKERGRQSELPLFTCTREEDRGSTIVNNGEGASQVCTTCVGNEAEKRAAEVSWKLISPGGRVITRNFGKTKSILGKKFVYA